MPYYAEKGAHSLAAYKSIGKIIETAKRHHDFFAKNDFFDEKCQIFWHFCRAGQFIFFVFHTFPSYFSVLPFHFFSSTYRKVYVSVDISLNIRGYFITYPWIFHYVSTVTRVFCFVLAVYWLYAFVFSHMDWHIFFCSDLLSEVTHTGKHYRKKKSKKRFFERKV